MVNVFLTTFGPLIYILVFGLVLKWMALCLRLEKHAHLPWWTTLFMLLAVEAKVVLN
jgi:hypothetical protein